MKSVRLATAAACLAMSAAPALAQGSNVLTAITQDDMVRLAEAGENTVTQRSEDGAPTILVQTSEGFSYYMIGNACGEAGCNGVKLSARFSPDETVTPDMVNAINKDVPPVKLWFDETTLAVERYLILDQGLSEDTLLFELSTFAVLVPNVIERFAAAPSE